MEEHEEVRFFVHRIISECELNQMGCKDYRGVFLEYKHLWGKDITKTLEEFLETALKKSEEGGELPQLDMFDERIAHYKVRPITLTLTQSLGLGDVLAP